MTILLYELYTDRYISNEIYHFPSNNLKAFKYKFFSDNYCNMTFLASNDYSNFV